MVNTAMTSIGNLYALIAMYILDAYTPTHIILIYSYTCVLSFSEAIQPYDDVSDHHYYDNFTQYSYYCSY